MNRVMIVAALIVASAGCSAAQKKSKATSGSISNTFSSSASKVGQDLTQTRTDLGALESEIKIPK